MKMMIMMMVMMVVVESGATNVVVLEINVLIGVEHTLEASFDQRVTVRGRQNGVGA